MENVLFFIVLASFLVNSLFFIAVLKKLSNIGLKMRGFEAKAELFDSTLRIISHKVSHIIEIKDVLVKKTPEERDSKNNWGSMRATFSGSAKKVFEDE